MLPGAISSFSLKLVWMQSITTALAFNCSAARTIYSTHWISVNRIGDEAAQSHAARASPAAPTRSSTNVLHCWHDGHRPIHFGDVAPHCWQTYWVLLFMR